VSVFIEKPRFSCALAAQQTVLAIPGGIPVIHAGPGCASKAAGFAGAQAGLQGEGYAGRTHISCTNAGEREVVFGGEKNLEEVIDGALKVIKGDLYVALSGCTAGIIGDDTQHVAEQLFKKGYPVVGVDTAGFKGNNYFGHELVVNAIIDQFVGEQTPQVKKGLVNVFSVVPYQNPFWRGDLEAVKALLEKLGLEVNILFGIGSDGVSEWKNIPNAEFNLLLSPWVGLSVVEHLKAAYGTPYFHYDELPVGAQATSKFLRAVGEFAGLDKVKVEEVIQKEEKRFYDYLISFSDFVAEQRNVLPYQLYIAADSTYAVGIADYFTNELGFLPHGIYITDDPAKEKETYVLDAFKKTIPEYIETVRFEADGGIITEDIEKKLAGSKKALIFGSYWEQCIARETNNFFVHLSLPVTSEIIVSGSYVGYEGGLRLLEKVYTLAFGRGNLSSRTHVE
jgi:nitrogenase molybdenum-iron protein beta chain